jgi:hypothetical protein
MKCWARAGGKEGRMIAVKRRGREARKIQEC